eukprot:scaffold4.g4949.t1
MARHAAGEVLEEHNSAHDLDDTAEAAACSLVAELMAGESSVAVATIGDRLLPRLPDSGLVRRHSVGEPHIPGGRRSNGCEPRQQPPCGLPPTPGQGGPVRHTVNQPSADADSSSIQGSDASRLSSPFSSVHGGLDAEELRPPQPPALVAPPPSWGQRARLAESLSVPTSPAMPGSAATRSSIDLLLSPHLALAHAAGVRAAGAAASRFSMDDRVYVQSAILPDRGLRGRAPAPALEMDPGFPHAMSHVLTSAVMRDLADSSTTVTTAEASPVGPVGVPGLPAGYTASAWASSVVDQQQKVGGADGSPQTEMLLDPDIHDVFGAHECAAPALARRPPAVGASMPASLGSVQLRSGADGGGATPRSPFALGGRAAAGGGGGSEASGSADAAPAAVQRTMLLEPSTVPGQHSVTAHDPQCIVPSYNFLRQRQLAKQRLAQQSSGGGYIAEAKRVLSAAINTADPTEVVTVETSSSGAIGPLLKYLHDRRHDDAALAASLQTLSVLVANSPNRSVVVSFKGQAMLLDAMRATSKVELQESIVQLLWDLDAAYKDCTFEREDVRALLTVLEATENATVASHILHFLHAAFTRATGRPQLLPGDLARCAGRLVQEVAAHKHHLQDAAQYTVGNLLASVMGDSSVQTADRQRLLYALLVELARASGTPQCQLVLTVLSCLAGNPRLRSDMVYCQASWRARKRLMEFSHRMGDPRLRARSLSLVKVLNKQELLETSQGWYFGNSEPGPHVAELQRAHSPPSCPAPHARYGLDTASGVSLSLC